MKLKKTVSAVALALTVTAAAQTCAFAENVDVTCERRTNVGSNTFTIVSDESPEQVNALLETLNIEVDEDQRVVALTRFEDTAAVLSIPADMDAEGIKYILNDFSIQQVETDGGVMEATASVTLSSDDIDVSGDGSNDYISGYMTLRYYIRSENALGVLKECESFSGGWTILNNNATFSNYSAKWWFVGSSTVTAKVDTSTLTFKASGSAKAGRATLKAESYVKAVYNSKSYPLTITISI